MVSLGTAHTLFGPCLYRLKELSICSTKMNHKMCGLWTACNIISRPGISSKPNRTIFTISFLEIIVYFEGLNGDIGLRNF